MTEIQLPTTRRQFLKTASIGSLGWAGLDWSLDANNILQAADAKQIDAYNRFPRLMQEFMVEQVRAAEAKSLEQKMSLKTKADAEAHVQSVQEKIKQSFGPQPERTPLNARITNVVERDGYQIENVVFESRPQFYVTANLYLPTNRSGKVPGVVGTCGHSHNGKASSSYQSFAQGLARLGHACLIYDPIGQGERLQYVNDKLKSRIGAGVREHLHSGNQQYLVGDFLGAWRAWDGIRALDYLLSRDEIDHNHLGVTGNSGGGTMTTWLCGVEQRWTMAAPSCFVTTFLRNCQNELPADTEQCPPRAIGLGLDHDDFLAALAPKPIVIMAKERDYFDVRGAIEAYRRLKHLYKLFGKEENVSLHIGPTYHGYSQENREAMYRLFNKVTGVSDATSEPKLTIEKDETLYCAPNGQVSELDSKTVFGFTQQKSKELAAKRTALTGDTLNSAVAETLKLPVMPEQAPEYRILRANSKRDYPTASSVSYRIETEPRAAAMVTRLSKDRHYSRPLPGQLRGDNKRAVLYVSHLSSDAELRNEPLVKEIFEQEKGAQFFACDVRGIGDSQPNTCGGSGSFHSAYGNDFFYAAHSLMIDRPYLGQRTFDVLRVLQWLNSVGYSDVHLVANGWGALPATFSALLCDQVKQVTLKNSLTSYATIAESEDYHWPLSALLPNVLESFDLPDCYAVLAESKQLKQIDPAGAEAKLTP